GERGEAHPVPRTGRGDHLQGGGYGGVLLEVDVEPQPGVVGQRLVQPHEPVPGAVPQAGGLLPGEVGQAAASVGRAVDGVVVEQHDDTVGGAVDVGLEVPQPQPGDVLERGAGVLDHLTAPAAVGQGQRARPAQVGAPTEPATGQGVVHCPGATMVRPSEARKDTGSTVVP